MVFYSNMQRNNVLTALSEQLNIPIDQLDSLLTKPKDPSFGDITLPVFSLAKGSNPVQLAQEMAQKIENIALFSEVTVAGPYINIFFHQTEQSQSVIESILTKKEQYGAQQPEKKTYVIDYSAPNIAKPFGIGHLRSTVIGNAVQKSLSFFGHKVIGINYIGDWGTQFGKVICAYQKWGDEVELEKAPVAYLLELYVKFHKEAENDETLNDEAREIFAQLEQGNKEYLALWKRFRSLSITEFDKMYELMNITFDEVRGESYYNEKVIDAQKLLEEKGLLTLSDGAQIIDFEKFNSKLPPIIMVKSNGASTYALRDVAAAIDRVESFTAEYLLYEVGAEQKLHFQQLQKTLELLGYEWAKNITHIDHGFYRFENQKFSTRKGNIVLMEDVVNESISKVKELMSEKNPDLVASDEFETIAKHVGVSAIIFYDMKNDRVKDVNFDWNAVLDFQGESGPYLQYTHARLCSILRKFGDTLPTNINYDRLKEEQERLLLTHLGSFSEAIEQSLKQYKPHVVARYVLELSQLCNNYYAKNPIISEDEELTHARIVLMYCVRQVLQNGLRLLGITPVTQM